MKKIQEACSHVHYEMFTQEKINKTNRNTTVTELCIIRLTNQGSLIVVQSYFLRMQ